MKANQRRTARGRGSKGIETHNSSGFIEPLEPRTLLSSMPVLVRDPGSLTGVAQAGGKTFLTDWSSGLYVTNGTAGGTLLVKSFGRTGAISAIGNEAYFTTESGIWRSDGTTAGTVVVSASTNGDNPADVRNFVSMGGAVYFLLGGQLVRTDGTPGGTSSLKGFYRASDLTVAGDRLFFVGNDEVSGDELWTSDGTPGGTVLVKDLYTGSSGGMFAIADPHPIAALGNRVVFAAYPEGGGARIFVTDGTAGGTVRLSNDAGVYGELTSFKGAVYFSGYDASQNQQLWKTDGTIGGTVPVKALGTTGFANRAGQLTVSGNRLFFAARDGSNGFNLWKSDGTANGTAIVKGTATGSSFSGVYNLTDIAGAFAFTAADASVQSGAYSLWTSDGSTAGTVKIRDTFTSGMQGVYGTIAASGTIALFTANDGVGTPELYALQTAATLPVPQARTNVPSNYVVGEGGTIALHGYTSAQPLPGRPLTYQWDLDGDGVFGETGAAAARGTETGTDPTFRAAGLDGPSTYTARFRISDSTGYTSNATADIAITNVAPTLNVTGGPAVHTEGNLYTLNFSATDPGPDVITQWLVDWGDGVTQSFPAGTTSATHTYPMKAGEYGVYVTAVDEDGRYRFGQPAAYDPSFGSGGKVFSQVGATSNQPNRLLVQPDGKILALSSVQSDFQAFNSVILVSRYNPDGALDSKFGIGGRVFFGPTGYGELASGMMLQPDGRIVVAGNIRSNLSPYDIGASLIMLRLLPDGSLDPTFGGPGAGGADGQPGWVTYQFGLNEAIAELALDSDGKIVAAGVADQALILARFNANGSLDASFGTGGKVNTGFPANGEGATHMVIQPDRKILLVPVGYPPASNFLTMRFKPDGSPDSGYGVGGRSTIDGLGAAYSLSLLPSGSILVAGSAPGLPTEFRGTDTVVARLTAAGVLDTTFASGGLLRTAPAGPFNSSVPPSGMWGPIVRTLPDGRFLVGGTYELDHLLLVDRYNPDGTPDTSFAPNARFAATVNGTGNGAILRDLVLQPDGSPLIYAGAGTAHNPTEAIVRLTPTSLAVRVVESAFPNATIDVPPGTLEGSLYTLGLHANDPDNDGITEWIVNWGDGSVDLLPGNPTSVKHVYVDGPNNFLIRASAIDGDQSITRVTGSVAVANVAPTVTVTGDASAPEAAPYSVQFAATDPGDDRRTSWIIDWGDGKNDTYTPATTSAQHVYQEDGTYSVTVRMTDEDGTFAATPRNAVITNVPPKLAPLIDRVAAAKAAFVLSFFASDVVREQFGGTVNWGDGSTPTPFGDPNSGPTLSQLFQVQHTYAARGTYTLTVNLNDGDGGTTSDTATVQVGDVVVRVFEDLNGDGIRNSGDAPRVGDIAFLDLDRDGVYDPGDEPLGSTDDAGDVLFDGLASGASQSARVVAPPDHHLSTPASIEVTPGTATAVATFGLTQVATVRGVMFDDVNANSVRDRGEGPPPSLGVRARNVLSGVIVPGEAIIMDGSYRITGLMPGQYVIEMTDTSRVITSPRGRRGYLVTLTGGESEIVGLDLGSFGGAGATISGTLFSDYNHNGIREANEPGIYNQLLYLDADDDGVRDAEEYLTFTNSSNGDWSFLRLPGGTYHIRQEWPTPDPNDPAVAPRVTVAMGQVLTGINIARYTTVLNRRVFYNDSVRDGNDPRATGQDDNATDSAKAGLLPGGIRSAANVSGYTKGLNGIVIDIAGLPPGVGPTVDDFSFRASTGGGAWALGPTPSSVTIRRSVLFGGIDRITLIWDASGSHAAIQNGWLEVTMKPTAVTALTAPDIFAFGNLVGDANGDGAVTVGDVGILATNFGKSSGATMSQGDFNADGAITVGDLGVLSTAFGRNLAPPPAIGAAVLASGTKSVRASSTSGTSAPVTATSVLTSTKPVAAESTQPLRPVATKNPRGLSRSRPLGWLR